MITVFFDNCLACRNGAFEVPDGTSVSSIIDKCRERWGDGRLVKVNGELSWAHDHDAKWIGCCAEKVYGKRSESEAPDTD